MRRCAFVICLVTLAMLVILVALPGGLAAQGTVTWSEPFNISDSPTSSAHPAIVADSYGYVHVFWSEELDGRELAEDELPDSGNTIMYRRWDGHAWTEPLSILAVTDDPLAEFVSATIDQQDCLHLVWTGMTRIYYSSAPAANAYSARSWSAPEIISFDSARSQFESDVAVDSQGRIHVVYASKGREAGVCHTVKALDKWSLPICISDPLRRNEVAFANVRLVVDGQDRLHVAWSTSNTNGYSQAVYYARSEAGGESWQMPVLMEDATIKTGFTGLPSLLAYGPDQLLLIHVGEANHGRVERSSTDGGRTWSAPHTVLPSMEGVNGFMVPLVDGGGDLHLVINMRPVADQRVGIYYAPRAEPDWASVVPVAIEEPYGPTAHYTDATIRLGNEIHVVWTQLAYGEVWYVRGVIHGLEPAAPQPTPTRQPTPTPTPAGEPTLEPAPAESLGRLEAAPDDARTMITPVILATLPVLLLVVAVIVLRARMR